MFAIYSLDLQEMLPVIWHVPLVQIMQTITFPLNDEFYGNLCSHRCHSVVSLYAVIIITIHFSRPFLSHTYHKCDVLRTCSSALSFHRCIRPARFLSITNFTAIRRRPFNQPFVWMGTTSTTLNDTVH